MVEISNFEKLIKIAGFMKPQNIKINLFFFFFKYNEILVGLTRSAVWERAKCASDAVEKGSLETQRLVLALDSLRCELLKCLNLSGSHFSPPSVE